MPPTSTDDGPFDEAIADGVKAGDPDAVGAVYVALADRLMGYLMARVRDRGIAEDLLEATFIELLQSGHTIRGGARAMKVWLYRAAHYNALDHLRKVSRRREDLSDDLSEVHVVDPGRPPDEHAVASAISTDVRAAMQQLSEEQRQVLLLRYMAGLSAGEVARILDKNDGAIRSLQHRGERSLARLLAPKFSAPSTPRRTSQPAQERMSSRRQR